jgi:hypothetical protein
LEIKQGSFIQQTQYFIPVEIDLSVVPAYYSWNIVESGIKLRNP